MEIKATMIQEEVIGVSMITDDKGMTGQLTLGTAIQTRDNHIRDKEGITGITSLIRTKVTIIEISSIKARAATRATSSIIRDRITRCKEALPTSTTTGKEGTMSNKALTHSSKTKDSIISNLVTVIIRETTPIEEMTITTIELVGD
jgi:hypothetical protein